MMAIKVQPCVFTLRLKVKAEGYDWLNAAATEVNQVWNYANATSYKAARPFAGKGKWLTAYELDKLTAGATECFERIGSGTIQRVNAEFATRRKQFKKSKLRWRVSQGAKRSLGWLPFKAVQLKRKGRSLRSQVRHFGSLSESFLKESCGNRAASRKMQSGTGGSACRWKDEFSSRLLRKRR